MDSRDVKRIVKYCDQVLDLNNARLSDEYFYQSLSLCVIDAVYSTGVRYEAVRQVVHKYCAYFSLRRVRENRSSIPPKETQESTADFLRKMHDSGIEKFTREIFCNKQRTSTRNGILKSEAVFKFAMILKKYDINYLQDVSKIISDASFEREVKSIPGQRTGTSLRYFFMLSGNDDLVKPDRMILRFLECALQRPINPNEALSLLVEATRELKCKYSHLVPRLLDHEIWKYQRHKSVLRKQSKC